MNPLCCIAPVSIDRDKGNPAVVKSQAVTQSQLGFDNNVAVKPVSFSSRQSFTNAQVNTDSDSGLVHENEENGNDSKEFKGSVSVAGVLYKWVNYGKGWRARWFVLEDGVLSYYKVHGPDKIAMSPGKEKGLKVIGDESWRYMRKGNVNNNRLNGSNKWKAFGEIHLKVCLLFSFVLTAS